jgi:hypothetical protein
MSNANKTSILKTMSIYHHIDHCLLWNSVYNGMKGLILCPANENTFIILYTPNFKVPE